MDDYGEIGGRIVGLATAMTGFMLGPTPYLPSNGRAYSRTDVNAAELFETLTFRGFWNLVRKYYRDGLRKCCDQ